jgi:hypothetical protein
MHSRLQISLGHIFLEILWIAVALGLLRVFATASPAGRLLLIPMIAAAGGAFVGGLVGDTTNGVVVGVALGVAVSIGIALLIGAVLAWTDWGVV